MLCRFEKRRAEVYNLRFLTLGSLMTSEAGPLLRAAIELGDDLKGGPASPGVAAQAALALVTALLQALRDRGVLSRDEIDDVLADAAGRTGYGNAVRLVERVRAELERQEDE
jgi:hypothetical protein